MNSYKSITFKKVSSRGMSLLEILIVLIVIGFIVSRLIPNLGGSSTEARNNVSRQMLGVLQTAVNAWILEYSNSHGMKATQRMYNFPPDPDGTFRYGTNINEVLAPPLAGGAPILAPSASPTRNDAARINRNRFELIKEYLSPFMREKFSKQMYTHPNPNATDNFKGSRPFPSSGVDHRLGLVISSQSKKSNQCFIFRTWVYPNTSLRVRSSLDPGPPVVIVTNNPMPMVNIESMDLIINNRFPKASASEDFPLFPFFY